MHDLKQLLDPKSIAVVGASPTGGRGAGVLANLKRAGYTGELYAVHPRHTEVSGTPCVPTVADLPQSVDCLVIAIAAEAACDVLEQAYEHGIRAAVILSSGFGEGGHGGNRVARLEALAEKGMRFCGPNCFGLINARSGAAMFSGPLPALPLRAGPVALVSQSGGLGQAVVTPLMRERKLGFSHFVSCGNQIGTTIEDFVGHLVEDGELKVIAVVVEALKKPQRLLAIASRARALGKTLLFHRIGKSDAGQAMVSSHTGALTSTATIFSAFLRQCGIVEIDSYDQFVEAIALFAALPEHDADAGTIVVSGSGGGAAMAADALTGAGVSITQLEPPTQAALGECLPGFGSVGNPIDCTGSVYDDPTLLPRIFSAIGQQSRKSIIAMAVLAFPAGSPLMRRLAGALVDCRRSSGWPVVAYQASALGGPLDDEMVGKFNEAGIPFLLGVSNAMGALRYVPVASRYRALPPYAGERGAQAGEPAPGADFLSMSQSLRAAGMAIIPAETASSEDAAVAVFEAFQSAVAVKIEIPGLLHKSDVGGVILNCDTADKVRDAYRQATENARRAGYADARTVLIQPMLPSGAELFVGAIHDPLYGTAITLGFGGIYVEILKDTATEMAPLDAQRAGDMIRGLKGSRLLEGARGQGRLDVGALAEFLVRFSRYAFDHAGQFRSLELNPIIVRPDGQGVIAVDIAIEH